MRLRKTARRSRGVDDLLLISVGHVDEIIRGTPRQVAVVALDDPRSAGETLPENLEHAGDLEPHRIERRRRSQLQVRIIGDERVAGIAQRAAYGPQVLTAALVLVEDSVE